MDEITNKEEFELDHCHAWVYRQNGKVVLCVEQAKPMAFVIVAGFVKLLGEPIAYSIDESDCSFIMAFKDNPDEDLTRRWQEAFPKQASKI